MIVKKLFPLLFFFLASCTGNSNNIVESTGTIEATQVDIRAEAGGKILKLYFDEGDRVKPGEVFAEIDHEKLDYELQQARAKVRELQARLALVQKGFRKEEIKRVREAQLDAEVHLKNMKKEYQRIKKLFDEGVVSDDAKDNAEAAYQSALKRYEMARWDYQLYQEGYRKEEILSAKAAKENAMAVARLLERKIKDATVTIPCKGVINERYVEPGELVSPGGLLATVVDLHDMWIMAYVSEKNLGKVSLGQKGKIFVDSFPGRAFEGRVTYISPEAEFTPKNIQTKEERVKLVFGIKLEIDNVEEVLKPGMPADVIIEAGGNK